MSTKAMSVILFAACANAYASFDRGGDGARISGLGGGGMGLWGDPWGALLNPAAAAGVPGVAAGLTHQPAPFGLTELRRSAIVCAVPFQGGTVELSGSRFGFELYREFEIGLAFGRRVTDEVSAGIAARGYRLMVAGYGSAWGWGITFGFHWRASESLSLGCVAVNVNAPRLGVSNERLPQSIGAGALISPFPGLSVLIDIDKELRFPPELRIGLEYVPVKNLFLRFGTSRDPATYGAGFGLSLEGQVLEYSATRHDELGFTHQFTLTFNVGQL
ncbi:MAG: hypothetical protein AB1428_04830 [Bacteroidota bacterium]